MEGNIKVKVQTNVVIAIHLGDSTVTINPLKMRRFIQDLGLAKRKATQLKLEKIQIDKFSYQQEKLYAEALLDVLSKAIVQEINTTLNNQCMACYDPEVQVHSCYLNNPREKLDRSFDNTFELVDLWSANEMTFEKTKDKIQVAVKDKDLYLRCSDLLRNLFSMDRLKTKSFVSLFIFPWFNGKHFKLILKKTTHSSSISEVIDSERRAYLNV